ncbi:hypothetical protein ACO02O_01480 [Dirofilaria immitis]
MCDDYCVGVVGTKNKKKIPPLILLKANIAAMQSNNVYLELMMLVVSVYELDYHSDIRSDKNYIEEYEEIATFIYIKQIDSRSCNTEKYD